MHIPKITDTHELPQGTSASMHGNTITVKGAKGELSRLVGSKMIKISIENNHVTLTTENATKTQKRELFTASAHVKNMIKGVTHGHTYKLKICSGHFPMTVALKGDTLEIKNFIGEAVPRKLKIKNGAKVTIAGTDITVEAPSKEVAGSQAAAIELLTRRPGFDNRVFQDGIYLVEKDGKKL